LVPENLHFEDCAVPARCRLAHHQRSLLYQTLQRRVHDSERLLPATKKFSFEFDQRRIMRSNFRVKIQFKLVKAVRQIRQDIRVSRKSAPGPHDHILAEVHEFSETDGQSQASAPVPHAKVQKLGGRQPKAVSPQTHPRNQPHKGGLPPHERCFLEAQKTREIENSDRNQKSD
jgi:hypothetical protein